MIKFLLPSRLLSSFFIVALAGTYSFGQYHDYVSADQDVLPYGQSFALWEKTQHYSKVYYVNNRDENASDDNPGTQERPFLTISKAAEVLEAGEKVIIGAGVYRESIHPLRGGTGPSKMITYEAAPGEDVIIKGSVILPARQWEPGKGWIYKKHQAYTNTDINTDFKVWMYEFSGDEFHGYNPFGMVNMLHDREYLQYQKVNMEPHFKRRGMLFVDGKPLEQVLKPVDLGSKPQGAFWVEHNGMRIHVRFPGNKQPGDVLVEATTKEQLFAPRDYGTGYIRIKGLHFMHCGNGFPVPQRGMISSNRGNHWIIENCTVEWANSVGIDLGNEMWSTVDQEDLGYHVVRSNIIRNCGIAGLEALTAPGLLVEDNLFENIGWQNAELAFESGAIKFHKARNCLIRRNVFRNITYAPGIWLDYLSNRNCRITGNLFTDITTARGAIYIEVSRNFCRVDHNIFNGLHSQYWISGDYGAGGSALYTDGSDSILFENNLCIDIENTGYGSYLNAGRIVGMRGGITRWHTVRNNIFIDCRKHIIEFPNPDNFSDYNVFCHPSPGYLKMAGPGEALLLDLEAWRKLYNCEQNGMTAPFRASVDSEALTLDFLTVNKKKYSDLHAGPFEKVSDLHNFNIDPRHKK